MKKITIIVLMLLIVILVILFMINMTGSKLTKEDFIGLMNNLENVPNFKREEIIIDRDPAGILNDKIINKSITYKKNELVSIINEDDDYANSWSNSETKELIRYIPSEKIYVELNLDDVSDADNTLENSEYKFIRI